MWPLRRRVTDAQVAMYLEECDPTLEAAIISAVEATADGGSSAHSPRLVEKLVEQAMDQCRALDDGRAIERTSVQRHAATLAAIAAITALIVAFGPAYLRHGLSALLVISRSAEASSPYSIEVTPGNTKVPRGADQTVKAKLVGFTAADVSVMMRTAPNLPFDRVPLIAAAEPGTFEGMLFHLEKETEYFVESNGVHSPHLHAVGRQPADRLGARGRVPLPRLHRACRRERPKAATSPRSAAPRSSCASCRR